MPRFGIQSSKLEQLMSPLTKGVGGGDVVPRAAFIIAEVEEEAVVETEATEKKQ